MLAFEAKLTMMLLLPRLLQLLKTITMMSEDDWMTHFDLIATMNLKCLLMLLGLLTSTRLEQDEYFQLLLYLQIKMRIAQLSLMWELIE